MALPIDLPREGIAGTRDLASSDSLDPWPAEGASGTYKGFFEDLGGPLSAAERGGETTAGSEAPIRASTLWGLAE